MKGAHLSDARAANHGHVPVMRTRMGDLLEPAITAAGESAVIIDGTLGAGGHAESFLTRFPHALLIGVDRDQAALADATQRLAPFAERFLPLHARFDEFADALETSASPIARRALDQGIAGGFFDLGVSSMQLDQQDRGFAYKVDAPLDMRMDQSDGPCAADILNTYSHGDLARILKTYGDERFAGKIASAIVREREKAPFSTSGRLVELLYQTIPAATRRSGGHPAKRTFQALRVEVNKELEAIENLLPAITGRLRVGGRAVFMSYQSLEDKLVKSYFTQISTSTTPPGLPIDLPGTAAEFKVVTRGAEKASQEEIAENPRSASVRVRAIERVLDRKERNR